MKEVCGITYQDYGNSEIPIFEEKKLETETMIHVCTEGTCFLPTSDVTEAVKRVIQ